MFECSVLVARLQPDRPEMLLLLVFPDRSGNRFKAITQSDPLPKVINHPTHYPKRMLC